MMGGSGFMGRGVVRGGRHVIGKKDLAALTTYLCRKTIMSDHRRRS